MAREIENLIRELKNETGVFLSLGLGVFIFILFFQPFPFKNLDFNNGLVFVSGFGVITVLTLGIVRTFLSWMVNRNGSDKENNRQLSPMLSGFLILLVSSVAFTFYLRYVGSVRITFIISIKVFLICLAPPLILSINDKMVSLIHQNNSLIIEKKIAQGKIEKYEEDYLNKTVEFISENSGENFSLLIAEVVCVKSADNYVEIIYVEGESLRRKLIRNTMKNIERQLKQYSNFFRCHRICIVNLHFIDKLVKINNSNWIIIKGFNEQLPVSHQYLLKLKESL